MTKSILVTGGTGLLGRGIEKTAPEGVQIVSVHERNYIAVDSKAHQITLDLREKRAVDGLFSEFKFDAVVHAAGIASVDFVEKNYAESLESNIVGTLNIASACRRAGIHLIYVSTNAVFDGRSAPYDESSTLSPVNKYGRVKIECERLIVETLDLYSIMRPILMYGWNDPHCRPNPVTWIHEKLSRGERIELVTDVIENPLYNIQAGNAVWAMIHGRTAGVIHVAGKDPCSRYDFGLRIARIFGLDASLITPVTSARFSHLAPRPPNTTLSIARMERELGVSGLTLEEGLSRMKSEMAATQSGAIMNR